MNCLKGLKQFWTEEEGMGTVEIILIIVVLVGLVILFKGQITQIVNSLFQKITKQSDTVYGPAGEKRIGGPYSGRRDENEGQEKCVFENV